MKIKPLADRILVEQTEAVTKTESGIVVINRVIDKPNQGKVVAVGPGAWNDKTGERRKPEVKVGNTVLFPANAGIPVKVDGKDYLMMKEIDFLGVLSSK